MPKIDYTGKLEEFEKWVARQADPNKYMVYITDENVVIMRPMKSTSTYDYAVNHPS